MQPRSRPPLGPGAVSSSFNHRRDVSRVPFAVCKPRTTSEVVAAVKLAEAHNCRVSVCSGGHSWAAWSVRQDAVLIDLFDLDLIRESMIKTLKLHPVHQV